MPNDIFPYPPAVLGIIGGGQLGKMMAQAAKKMGFRVNILDPTPASPAGQVADQQLIGDFYDASRLEELAQISQVLTYDIEHIDTATLKSLRDRNYRIFPDPELLDIIQDKLVQKQVLQKAGIPVPDFVDASANPEEAVTAFGYPAVQKARKGGYDGRGVKVLKAPGDLVDAIPTASMVEQFVDFEVELAVMVARGSTGQIACYPVVEMEFDDRANICDFVIAPARLPQHVSLEAQQIAIQAIEALNGVGVFGVEMFLTREQEILVNEIAPRPHNSGHYTIEACMTSQFEQHIRAILGLPLGSTQLETPAVMFNLLGEPGYEGQPQIEGLRRALAIPGLAFHLYGKAITRPFRKMGHVTITKDSLDEAISTARSVKSFLKITSEGSA